MHAPSAVPPLLTHPKAKTSRKPCRMHHARWGHACANTGTTPHNLTCCCWNPSPRSKTPTARAEMWHGLVLTQRTCAGGPASFSQSISLSPCFGQPVKRTAPSLLPGSHPVLPDPSKGPPPNCPQHPSESGHQPAHHNQAGSIVSVHAGTC